MHTKIKAGSSAVRLLLPGAERGSAYQGRCVSSLSFSETSGFAGGSCSSTVPGMVRYASGSFAPFPLTCPSPSGRGHSAHRAVKAERPESYFAARRVHSLPKGEGWGEGKETTARRRANVHDLSCGLCPKSYKALSHSRFQAAGYAGGL